jgi:Fe-S-cluster containining protein
MEQNIDWQRFYKDFELPLKWLKLAVDNPEIHVCPFLGAENGNPTCIIYDVRPEMCKATFCKWMKPL